MDGLHRHAEEAGLNAWPALQEILYDGWLIRLGAGQTRRTNSVNVIAPGSLPLADKIAHCEAIYAAHEQPIYFRIRSNAPRDLDLALDARGYRAEAGTLTLFMDFARTPPPACTSEVELLRRPSSEWLDAHTRLNGHTAADGAILNSMACKIAVPAAFVAMRDGEGAIASLAYGAVHDRMMCVQWVVTDAARRRRGLSRAVLARLLDWARCEGVRGACLQVLADNHSAIALYESLGFDTELYRYHYRTR
jgi:GNAT superfamily N-acetyltransferase